MRRVAIAVVVTMAVSILRAQGGQPSGAAHGRYDEVLDQFVRDGEVYYRALKLERAKLDGFVASLASASMDAGSPAQQIAFWINAYNAFVLRTVIDNYPITQRSREYPPHSIRQIPGAFERLTHRAAGRTVTLDQIEQTILPSFHDPRVFLALGRGAAGSGRLRSEAFDTARLDTQLAEVAAECVARPQCWQTDRVANKVWVSSIFSWREKEFTAAYADHVEAPFTNRSPVERAVLAFVSPKLLTTEREFLAKNDFQVAFKPFDWTLNDLSARGGR